MIGAIEDEIVDAAGVDVTRRDRDTDDDGARRRRATARVP